MANSLRLKILGLGVLGLGVFLALMLIAQPGSLSGTQGTSAAGPLVGTFSIDPIGGCSLGGSAGVPTSGSHFRMTFEPPFGVFPVFNGTDECFNATGAPPDPILGCIPAVGCFLVSYGSQSSGTDGGLTTDDYQPGQFNFDAFGNNLTGSMAVPHSFFGLDYALVTEPAICTFDLVLFVPVCYPQPIPSVTDNGGGTLSANLASFGIGWQFTPFIQGSPRADAGAECADDQGPVTGTYDANTGAYTMDWKVRIGSAFGCDFVGHWHLEGTFSVHDADLKAMKIKQPQNCDVSLSATVGCEADHDRVVQVKVRNKSDHTDTIRAYVDMDGPDDCDDPGRILDTGDLSYTSGEVKAFDVPVTLGTGCTITGGDYTTTAVADHLGDDAGSCGLGLLLSVGCSVGVNSDDNDNSDNSLTVSGPTVAP